ncbi:MAG: extracellular solute-binding protein [Chloroflexi bacterium]|nr:extracellular solute-binding protein [Chloroflexota bacterium]
MAKKDLIRGVSRRSFLKSVGVGGAAFAAGSLPSLRPQAEPRFQAPSQQLSGDLRILQWSHFVPQYDKWFDPFTRVWGDMVGVNVSVDHVNLADIPGAAAAEIAAGEGHDLIEYLFPPSNLEPAVLDLTDVNEEADRRFGTRVDLTRRSTYNPTTGKYYGYCHSWVPDPANYRRSMWAAAGYENGPATWADLLEGGTRIRNEQGIQMGIGMSNELDSNLAVRAVLWAFGATEQDANENVTINSPETIAALEFMKNLYENCMTPEVFSWTAASNNQLLVAGQASYILNSISAYRTAAEVDYNIADDIAFGPPLLGPTGIGLVSEHVIPIYIIPNHARNPDAAKEFMLHLTANSDSIVFNSKLYNFPTYFDLVPELTRDGGWLDLDPFGGRPVDKLAVLRDAPNWSTVIGHPGPANPAIGEVFNTFILVQMFSAVARGEMTPEQAAADAEAKMVPIFERWKAEGLMGGGA